MTRVAVDQVVNTNEGRYEGTTQWRADGADLVPFSIVAQMDDFVVGMSDDWDPTEDEELTGP